MYIAPLTIAWFISFPNVLRLILIFPMVIDGYTRLMPGLMWKDLALSVWILVAIISVKRIGIFSISLSFLMFYLIIRNLFALTLNEYSSSFLSIFVTPIHQFLPLLAFSLLIENLNVRVRSLEKRYLLFLVLTSLILMTIRFGFLGGFDNMKQIPGVSASANFFALISGYFLGNNERSLVSVKSILIILVSVVLIYLTDTRGALLNFAVLIIIVTYIRLGFLRSGFLLIIFLIPLYFSLVPNALTLPSVFNLYIMLALEALTISSSSGLELASGDYVRFILWIEALNVWMEHFVFGIGTSQFDSTGLFTDRVANISPHHMLLDVAVDGGLVAVVIVFSPIVIILMKLSHQEHKQHRMLKYICIWFLLMSFILGYSFSEVFMMVLCIDYLKSKHDFA